MTIKLEDLLERKPIQVDLSEIQTQIERQVVLITGAGGSIGSELSRQLIRMKPSKMLIIDHSELNLYSIDNDLRALELEVKLETLLLDIKDLNGIKEAFEKHRPAFIYHAAAYKHVHLVEANPYSAIINNIQGTRNLIDCAIEFGIETFVMVSTDKAVNPSSVMGATKRICELMITQAGMKSQKRFCSVRFGNVLGSSGSLVPLLEKQIKEGGPVTITHPDMIRYFMSLDEAVRLVLKAGEISHPGDVNILKMGEPVKVIDLAKKVMTLMGKSHEEIEIKLIGKRPGEKLFEQLYLKGNERPTDHREIMVLPNGDHFNGDDLVSIVNRLIGFALNYDEKALKILRELAFTFRGDEYEVLTHHDSSQSS